MNENSVPRRRFLLYSACAAAAGLTMSRQEPTVAQSDSDGLAWHDVRDWGVEGRGWNESETEKYFDRLPKRANGVVRDAVWNLSRHSAGMLTRFTTDAPEIWVDYKVSSSRLAMPHMPATGVSGVDLYATDENGRWRWMSVSRPTAQTIKSKIVSSLPAQSHDFTAYLPLYNGTEYLKIGVPKGASFEPIAPRTAKPIVFYGTSITHGACASRPGMPHPAILGRRFNRPVINLGFSGNGKMELEVGQFLCELDPAVYVIDCLPNMVADEVAKRTEPLVKQLRQARPETPILLVEDRTYTNAPFFPSRQQRQAESRKALRQAYERLVDGGVERIGYLEGEKLLGDDREDTTDGSHPSDLGFYRHANAFEGPLRTLGI